MSPTVMLAEAWGLQAPEVGEVAPCGLCGATEPGRDADDVLKSGFTNRDELRSPNVCWACEAVLDDRRSRSSLLVASGAFRKVERREVWPLLLAPPEPPFLLYLTMSGQKHGAFRQQVATNPECFRVQCEDLHATFRPADAEAWMRIAGSLVADQVSREGVESGRYRQSDYDAVGIGQIREAERILGPVRAAGKLWMIVVGLMPSREHLQEMRSWLTSA